jgi:hypothetical protein
MRDPARIDGVLNAIRRAWKQEPDLRLGQLIVVAARPKEPCPEVFSLEDTELMKGLEEYLELKATQSRAVLR